ncbi:MAG: drug/metabolite transporter (DMT)-like permease [Verrucomicrobiales bacterium]
MTVLLGCLAAILFGFGDLLSGVGGRRDPSTTTPVGIAFVATVIGTVLGGLYVLLLTEDSLRGSDLWWAIGTGVAMSAARPLLYRGMAAGPMVVFAPIVALVALVLPAVLGLVFGQSLAALEIVGVILAVPAVVLLSSGRTLPSFAAFRSSSVVGNAAIVGGLIGIGALFMSFMSDDAGTAPALVVAAIGIVTIPLVGRSIGLPLRFSRTSVTFGLVIGCTSIGGLILSTFAYRGNAAIGSALIGLSPGVSILLAWRFLGERFWRLQVVGSICGITMVVLFALAS